MGWIETYPPHPAADAFPMIERQAMEDLVADIKAHGVRQPVVLWRDPETGKGRTLDGRNRFEASSVAGLALMQVPVRWAETDDPFGFVISANVHRRHLTQEQRRDVVARLVTLDPSRSDRQIAAAVGVSHPTVGKVRRELEESGDAERVTARTDTLGRVQPVPEPPRTYPDPELAPPPPGPVAVQVMKQARERDAKNATTRWFNESDSDNSPAAWFLLMLADFEDAAPRRLAAASDLVARGVDPEVIREASGRLIRAAEFYRALADEMSDLV